MAQANPDRRENGVTDRGRDHRRARLAEPGRDLGAVNEFDIEFGHVTDAQRRVAVEVRVLHLAFDEVSFGPFRLLPAQFLLLDGGEQVPIGSRALEVLIVLLERPGELVSKKELLARVWPDIFVDPTNVAVHVSALRRTLRDGRDGNRFIINIPGRGYSFVASVEVSKREGRRSKAT